MQNIDYRMWIGMGIHSVFSFLQIFQEDLLLFYICLFFLIFNIIGLVLILSNNIKIGLIVFMIGCFGFIPIGLIGFFGAKKQMDKFKLNQQGNEIDSIGAETK